MIIPHEYRDLVGAPNYAHIATLNADGSPQSSVVWVQLDGEGVLFNSDARFKKARNMTRDPRVAISIHDARNPYRYIEVRGMAEIEPRMSYDLFDTFAKQYMGLDEYPFKHPDVQGVHVHVKVNRAIVHHTHNPPHSRPLPDGELDLLGAPNFGHVVTVMPAGQVCSSPVWIALEGDELVFWTGANTLKIRNLRHNPAISISVHDESNPMRYTEVRGIAELKPIDNTDLLDKLARQY